MGVCCGTEAAALLWLCGLMDDVWSTMESLMQWTLVASLMS